MQVSAEPTSIATAGILQSPAERLHHDREKSGGTVPLELPNSGRPQEDTVLPQHDSKLVTWDGPNDKDYPRNWPQRRKWTELVLVASYTLLSPIASSMVAPGLDLISRDLSIKNQVNKDLVLSIFILGYALGPLLFGPLSETYGRRIILQSSNLFYLIWNIACAVSQTGPQIVIFRLLAGIGGSAPLVIGSAVVADCFEPEQRGKAFAIYALAPLLGPAIGPIMGGFIVENVSWRWVFYVSAIAAGVVQLFGVLLMCESHHGTLLSWKAKALRKATSDPEWYAEAEAHRTLEAIFTVALVRPFKLLFTQPIIQALALFAAYLYGLMYLMLLSFPSLWSDPDKYNMSVGIGSLNYISLGLGFIMGAQLCAAFNDRIFRCLKTKTNGVAKPEFRLPLLAVGAFMTPAGLFIYGWSAHYDMHWIVPDIGAFLFALGNILGFQCIQTYLVDTYTEYAASGTAAVVILRSSFGFAFPLFASDMFKVLGYGWGNSLLAFVSIGLGLPASMLLWVYGEKLRKMSPYAVG